MADDFLQERIRADLNAARKGRDRERTMLLTTLLAEIRNREIEDGVPADAAAVQGVVVSAIKRRREAAEQMRAGARPELAAREEREAELLAGYLPPPLAEDEVRQMVRDAIAGGAAELGSVMKTVAPRTKGRFEGRELNRLAREELG